MEFDDVSFGYVPNKMVLHNIKLEAKEGQKVSFVGATGAGKTTITNLINRFYDVQDGKIRYDGINIKKIKKRRLKAFSRNGFTRYKFVYRNNKRQYKIC